MNGQPWPYLKVEPRKYRFRILDTSISRAFQLWLEADGALGTKIPFNVIASDAGLLSAPVKTDLLHASIAERWEIVVDFAQFAGKNVTMRNNRKVQADDDFNSTDKVMRFVVGNKVTTSDSPLPSTLRSVPFPPAKTTVDRSFKFERKGGEWTINGVTFAQTENRILAKPQRGAVEVWELENSSGGWSHPVHIHLVDFLIIERTGGNRPVLEYEKNGLKDVVLLGVNEKVKVVARYQPFAGIYMFHCHNLIHEVSNAHKEFPVVVQRRWVEVLADEYVTVPHWVSTLAPEHQHPISTQPQHLMSYLLTPRQDNDMMAAFNVTQIEDFGYKKNETLFIDPMEPKWRAKDINPADFTDQAIQSKLAQFDAIDGYRDAEQIEDALEAYWSTASTGFQTSTKPASSTATSSTKSATITSSATTKSDDKSTKTSSTSTKATTTTKK